MEQLEKSQFLANILELCVKNFDHLDFTNKPYNKSYEITKAAYETRILINQRNSNFSIEILLEDSFVTEAIIWRNHLLRKNKYSVLKDSRVFNAKHATQKLKFKKLAELFEAAIKTKLQ